VAKEWLSEGGAWLDVDGAALRLLSKLAGIGARCRRGDSARHAEGGTLLFADESTEDGAAPRRVGNVAALSAALGTVGVALGSPKAPKSKASVLVRVRLRLSCGASSERAETDGGSAGAGSGVRCELPSLRAGEAEGEAPVKEALRRKSDFMGCGACVGGAQGGGGDERSLR
jgi:hypothetical protein